MARVAILTDFISHDPAYSLCGVVANQVKMLARGGVRPIVFVRKGWPVKDNYPGADIRTLDPGVTGSNKVEVTEQSETEITHLTNQIEEETKDVGLVMTHDIIFQPNAWKYHVACRRVARQRDDLRWLHWVHSATDMGVQRQTKQFRHELKGPFPHAKLVVMHREEMNRKRQLYGYEYGDTVIVPNAIDFAEDYHPITQRIIKENDLMMAGVIGVYPCRLDRGKQPHILIEIFEQLQRLTYDTRLIFVDFHSTMGDKATYRNEMKAQAERAGVPVLFVSEVSPETSYHVPHKVVMDLFDLADVFIHPSMSESDPLILLEAAWKRCGLILNYDLPYFHLYAGDSLQYKFSSNIDVTSGMPGQTTTNYGNRRAYMHDVAGGVAYLLQHNPVLKLHRQMRLTRSVEAVWRNNLWPLLSLPSW